ncbi:MAG: flavin reductase family protein [Rhodobacteraceae bacterium]|nr:flavin reductase family protein [Paracoccaceae bacterium]
MQKLREAFGTFTTGVTVVTTLDAAHNPIGFTANSFASVSLDPAILLVCMSQKSRSFKAMTSGAGFAINILSADQKNICDVFSQANTDRFANLDWRIGPNGYPLIASCSAWFECSHNKIIDAGDHTILLGNIVDFGQSDAAPLILSQGKFNA